MAFLKGRNKKGSRRRKNPEGAMPFMEHLRELRNRLVKSLLGVLAGLIVGFIVAKPVLDFLTNPYCERFDGPCQFTANTPVEPFVLELKVALYIGLLLASPIWLYQLWAFVAPGLHKREKRWTYMFVVVATPLFLAGAVLAHFVIAKGLEFLLPSEGETFAVDVNISGYVDFVIGMLLIFGIGFEFPLVVFMLNLAGVVSARKLLSYWRVVVFGIFVFTAFVTPTPDPFGMTALALPISALYFLAVGAAFLNERRKRKKALALSE